MQVVQMKWNTSLFRPLSAANKKRPAKKQTSAEMAQDSLRNQVEEAIRMLAAIVESSDDAIIGKTPDGVITSWNAGAERLYGYSAAEVVGKSITILASPDQPDDIAHVLERVLAGEAVQHYETRRMRKDGRSVEVSLGISAIRDREGKIIGVSTIARDITERKHAEQALNNSIEELRKQKANASHDQLLSATALIDSEDRFRQQTKDSSREQSVSAAALSDSEDRFRQQAKDSSRDQSISAAALSASEDRFRQQTASSARDQSVSAAALSNSEDKLREQTASSARDQSVSAAALSDSEDRFRQQTKDFSHEQSLSATALSESEDRFRQQTASSARDQSVSAAALSDSEDRLRQQTADSSHDQSVSATALSESEDRLRKQRADSSIERSMSADALSASEERYRQQTEDFSREQSASPDALRESEDRLRQQTADSSRERALSAAALSASEGRLRQQTASSSREQSVSAAALSDSEGRLLQQTADSSLEQSVSAAALSDSEGRLRQQTADSSLEQSVSAAALSDSEKRFLQVAESTGEIIWEVDANGLYVYVSPTCKQVLGYAPEELVGKQHIYSLYVSEAREPLKEAALKVFARKAPFRAFPSQNVKKDGSIVILESTGVPLLDSEGNLIGYRGAHLDATERKRAEEELLQYQDHLEEMVAEKTQDMKETVSLLGATLESTADGILVVDLTGKITVYNNNFLRLWDAPAALAEAGDDEKLLAFVTEKLVDPEAFFTRVKALYSTPEAEDFETIYLKDGRIFERLSLPQRLGEKIVGRVWNFRDVTERKRIAEALQLAKETAESASHAKSTFLSNMSHEIRTPMNAVLGYTQILQRDATLSPMQLKYVETIGRSGEFLLSLINDILEMSKIEAGKVTLAPLPMDFQALLGDVEAMFRVRTAENNLQFEVSRIGEVPSHIIADPMRVRQVIINMLGNAVKFTEKGGIVVRVYSGETKGDDRILVTVEVEDTGMGIPEDEVEHIFGSFEQTQRGQMIGGTGLGMAISRQLARLMGGDLTVKSQQGKGSTFMFAFNAALAKEEQVQAAQKAATARKVLGLASPPPGPRILVVDDKETNRDVLRVLLSMIGFTVRVAVNGKEGVEIFNEWHPHAILMDQRMPVMDGIEATKIIKDTLEGKATPIIMITASAMEESRQDALNDGADGFVRKPYKESELLDELGRVLKLEYVYEDALYKAAPPHVAEGNFAAEAGKLPAELTAGLLKAAEMGDSTRFTSMVKDQVMPISPAFGEYLLQLARDYRIDQIVQVLKTGGKS
jgi:PAS domain S-box-containing protein